MPALPPQVEAGRQARGHDEAEHEVARLGEGRLLQAHLKLAPFVDDNPEGRQGPKEASVLEICVYPILSEKQMVKIGRAVRSWAGLPPIGG